MKKPECVFPGTFDPFTVGHRHLVEKALELYDRVIVAVADITYKKDVLSSKTRVKIAAKSLADLPGVVVEYFTGMLTDFLATKGCFEIVRGIRNDEDAAYERKLAEIYKTMDPRVRVAEIRSDMPDISSERVRLAVMNGEDIRGLVCDDALSDVVASYAK